MMTHIQKLTRTQRGWYRTSPIAVAAATWLISASSAGAVDIQTINLNPLNDGADATPNPPGNVTYRNQSRSIASFTTGTDDDAQTPETEDDTQTWEIVGGNTPTLTLRRNGGTTYANRQVFWSRREGLGTLPYAGLSAQLPLTVLSGQATSTEEALGQNNIFLGTDNLFTNTGASEFNQSNVERADIVFGSSVISSSDLGVSVFERGSTGGHDGFKIAAITAVDGSNNPTQYGQILTFGTTTANRWGQTSLTGNQGYVVLNNSSGSFAATSTLSNTTQDIGGTLITLSELVGSATPPTTVYGYSLFAANLRNDATPANLVNWRDTTYFPTNTADGPGAGGIDLVASNLGVSRRAVPFGFSPSLGLLLLGATWGTQSLWKRYRIKPVAYSKGDRSSN